MEGNNVKAMFEALAEIVFLTMKVGRSIKADVACGIIAAKAKHALKTPPRNCDVGTVKEQKARFHRFCEDGQHTDKACCGGCPIVVSGMREKVGVSCEIAWAQMPYEEEGAK